MPSTVTAFSVKIVSPGGAGIEFIIAREVIGEWNALHALEQKRILLPLDGPRHPSPADLLVTFFSDSPGAPADQVSEGAGEEIENQLREGRPALIYFSEARIDLKGAPILQGGSLDEFKKRYMTATVDSYADDKEFRKKFARHLDVTVATHEHFKIAAAPSPAPPAPAPKPLDPRRTGPLTPWAQTILIEACDDFEAYIGRIKVGGMLKIQANGKQLVEQNDPAAAAKWESAFQELLDGEFIRDAGCNGQLFQISAKGFEFLKTIGKTPVGYIAELGGM
ncbi:MAG TPA: hypothetical protein VGZ93_03505 [Candidatus Methylacidiphilales bacterium]|jgi:hypothetical protein|nr:hypothetical protein [Candidatus Methylacidiphilales bacterium]